MKRVLLATSALLVATVGASREAVAQAWLADRALTQGPGLRLGDFELHPGVGAEFGYDSNTYAQPSGQEVPSLRLRFIADLSITNITGQRASTAASTSALPAVAFRANASFWWNQFIAIPGGAPLIANTDLSGPGGAVGFNLHVHPGQTYQLILSDDAMRAVQGGPGFGTNLFVYNQWLNTAGLQIVYSPHAGIFDLRLVYTNSLSIFTEQNYGYYDSDSNVIALRMSWRFFPKTALIWEGQVAPTFYLSPGGAPTGVFNSYPVSTRFGVNGLLTPRVGVLLMVGWTGTYFVRGDNASTPVAQAEFRYILGPTSQFSLGFIRDVNASFLGNYYIRDAFYVQLSQSFSGRFLVLGRVEAGRLDYGFVSDPNGARPATPPVQCASGGTCGDFDPSTGRFGAWRVLGSIFGEYRPSSVVGINVTLAVSDNTTSVVVQEAGMTTLSVSWLKFEAYLGVRVNW